MLYQFDVTDKCVAFMQESIKDMPGNPGQEVLVEELDYSGCRFYITAGYEGNDFMIIADPPYQINLRSNHPEAIEIIMQTAEESGELIIQQAEIPGPWAFADAVRTKIWKIVGWDSEWKL